MIDSMKTRFMCFLTAAAVIAGSLALPVTVRADDDDTYKYYMLKQLDKLTPEEKAFLYHLKDQDDDSDVDEDDVRAAMHAQFYKQMQEEADRKNKEISENQRQFDAQMMAAYEAKKRAEYEAAKAARVTGVVMSTTSVTLTVGQAYQVVAYVKPDSANNKTVYYASSNPSVATVDGNGVITATGVGGAVITATTDDGGYQACTSVDVNFPPAAAAQTVSQDTNWTALAANLITSAAPGQTLDLVAPKAMSFDSGMIKALKARPDVGLLIGYPYNGHTYLLAVPAGYNLSAHADKNGRVSFLNLAGVTDGKVITSMVN